MCCFWAELQSGSHSLWRFVIPHKEYNVEEKAGRSAAHVKLAHSGDSNTQQCLVDSQQSVNMC